MSQPDTTNQRPDEPPPGWIVSGGALCGPDGIWHVAETRDHALDVAWSAWREANDATDPTTAAEAITHYPTALTKRQIKRAYDKGEIGLSDALPALVFDHDMERGEAYKFLGL